MSIPNISGSTSQTAKSGATGGAFDAQGRFSFGGINTTGVGGTTSATQDGTQSYVSMAIIAAVVIAIFVLLKK